jgi:hypothetical protein
MHRLRLAVVPVDLSQLDQCGPCRCIRGEIVGAFANTNSFARRADCACVPYAICPSRQLAARCRCCALPQITSIIRAVPHSQEGRFAVVTNVERGMRWTRWYQRASLARTSDAVADGEVVWSWHPDADAKSARRFADDGGKKARSPGRARIIRKTIAWGMPDVSGASAVNTGVHTHYPIAHTRLRVHWAPGIPRALCSSKGESF